MPVVQSETIPMSASAGFNHNFETKDVSIAYRGSINAVAERVMLTCNDEEQYLVKVVIAQCRRPELGDKFSSRHGQKGVCGLISPQEDMPFDQQGVYFTKKKVYRMEMILGYLVIEMEKVM